MIEVFVDCATFLSRVLVCRSGKQWIFVGLQLAYVVLTLLAGFVLAFLTRRVANRVFFREAKWINYSVSTTADLHFL